jgi:hypothetical protein
MREWFKIAAVSIFAAVCYGIIHDQITARVCVEYFTVGHPPVFATNSPTALAFGWGILASWWVGLLLGMPLATMARVGAMPKMTARDLIKPLAVLMAAAAIGALCAGVIGFFLARAGVLTLAPHLAARVPHERHAAFLADLWAHNASYLIGFLGGVLLIGRVFNERRRRYILAENRG